MVETTKVSETDGESILCGRYTMSLYVFMNGKLLVLIFGLPCRLIEKPLILILLSLLIAVVVIVITAAAVFTANNIVFIIVIIITYDL